MMPKTMDKETLLKVLTEDRKSVSSFPMTPDAAAALIVEELAFDLSDTRKEELREAISQWGSEWGSLCSSSALESSSWD